jgi:hypothetical protein
MRLFIMLSLALLLGACYAPDAPSGSYTCGEHDSCPDGLSCSCGLCVSSPEQAACSFSITSPDATTTMMSDGHTVTSLSRVEHASFNINVTAYSDSAGTQASTYSGPVTLSSTWGDVCVGTSGCTTMPDQIQLSGGSGSATIQLNRATVPPQSAVLRASFAGGVGDSGDLRLTIKPPQFSNDAVITAPLSYTYLKPSTTSFGFANATAGAPSVVKTSTGWTLYYLGESMSGNTPATLNIAEGIGIATSSDGVTFSPQAQAVYSTMVYTNKTPNEPLSFGVPSAFAGGLGTAIYFGLGFAGQSIGYDAIADITAPLGSSTFGMPSALIQIADVPAPINSPGVTNVVTAIDVPMVIADPAPALTGGGPNASVMYSSAIVKTTTTPDGGVPISKNVVSVVRALAGDGIHFQEDPSPVLQSTLEIPIIYAPRVIVDGTVYKMFFATIAGLSALGDVNDSNPCLKTYFVGYATSTDGSFWIPSVSSVGEATPVFQSADGKTSVAATSIVPVDGVDPASGLAMYYSAFSMDLAGTCVLNGITRAKSSH